MYALVWSPRFTRAAKNFSQRHGELRTKFGDILRDLAKDPFQLHLKYHHPGGKLKGIQAVSITGSYRITLTVVVADREIILLDVGSHDPVYR